MATDRLSVVDSAVEDFYRWIHEIRDELGWADRHDALHAMRAVLHWVRENLEDARAISDDEEIDGEEITRAVFAVLTRHISPGEAEKLKHAFPKQFGALFG